MADTGIRTHKRKRPATCKRIRNQRRCRVGFSQIADYFFALTTQRLERLLQPLFINVSANDISASVGERRRQRGTNAGGRAGY
jgi:hypothetical protein